MGQALKPQPSASTNTGRVAHKARFSQAWYCSQGNDFDSVRGETLWHRGLQRDDWAIRTVTRTVLTSNPEWFHIRADLDAYQTDAEGEHRVLCKSWNTWVPRDNV